MWNWRERRWSRLQEALIIPRVVLFGRRGLSLSQEPTALPNHNELPWHTPRMALIKETDADKCQGGCGKTRVLYPGVVGMENGAVKKSLQFLQSSTQSDLRTQWN